MSRTIHASTLAELHHALSTTTGGETILLAGGIYGTLELTARNRYSLDFPSNVTIASADPANPASFSRLDVRGASNLTFEGLLFDYTFSPSHPIYLRPFRVTDSTNITIRNSVFDGDLAQGISETADGLGWAFALGVRGNTGFTFENNEVFNFFRGLVVGGSNDVSVVGNEFHALRLDGMNFSSVQGVLIEGNHLHNFNRSTEPSDHADMIQFWTNGTTRPSTDIVIRGNILDVGDGGATQSIFMRNDLVDRGLAGEEMFYRNVLIENNVIYNGHVHGITLGESAGVVIRNNSVLHAPGNSTVDVIQPVMVPRIAVASTSTDVQITGNVTATITGFSGQADWTVSGNAFVQPRDPNAPGFYGDVFVTSSLATTNGANAYVIRPGSWLDAMDVGSTHIQPGASVAFNASFHVSNVEGNAAIRQFDASHTTTELGKLPDGTRFLWDFGDGTTASGLVVTHAFPDGGRHTVTLTVQLPDGTRAASTTQIGVPGSEVLAFGPGGFRAMAFGSETLVRAVEGEGLALGAPGSIATIARSHIAPMFSAESFELGFSVTAAHAQAAGEVFRLHGSFIASVTSRGELQVRMFTANGERQLTTSGADMRNPDGRDVAIVVENGRLSVTVNGTEVGAAALPGPVSFSSTNSLAFGNPWGQRNFEGVLTGFEINIDMADYATARVMREAASEMSFARAATEDFPDAPAFADDPLEVQVQQVNSWQNAFHLDDWAGFTLSLEGLRNPDNRMLRDDAALVETAHGLAVRLDGHKDHVALGRMQQFEQSDRIGFSIDFSRTDVGNGQERLVWNHQKVGLTLQGDAIVVHAATANEGLRQFRINDAGVGTTDMTRVTVMLDAAEDRLQVLVNDRLLLDEQETDFHIVGAGGREWGWSLGTAWNRFFDGDIHDFRLGDRFEFLEGQPQDGLFA